MCKDHYDKSPRTPPLESIRTLTCSLHCDTLKKYDFNQALSAWRVHLRQVDHQVETHLPQLGDGPSVGAVAHVQLPGVSGYQGEVVARHDHTPGRPDARTPELLSNTRTPELLSHTADMQQSIDDAYEEHVTITCGASRPLRDIDRAARPGLARQRTEAANLVPPTGAHAPVSIYIYRLITWMRPTEYASTYVDDTQTQYTSTYTDTNIWI
jgi:hypothetical protein